MGKFGQAMASLLRANGQSYDYAEVAEGRLLSKLADLVIITVPTQFVRAAISQNQRFIPGGALMVNCSKGIEEETHLLVHQIVQSVGSYRNYYSLMGPSFAEGVVAKEPAVVSLGYSHKTQVPAVVNTLETPYFKIKPVKGYKALELASALENVYAIACGYAQGLGLGANSRVQLVLMALAEFRTLAAAMGFTDYDPYAPGVIGDLILKCSSENSRNFSYGWRLATGKGDAKDHTVEGYYTSHSINALAKQYGAKLPLAELTGDIIAGKVESAAAFYHFLASQG